MHFRSILPVLTCLMLASPAHAADKPYRVSLTGDGYDGKAWQTGVRIELDEGWKTYWRMPGEAGVPPEFTWNPSVPAHVEVHYPVPQRYADASGETVGYKHEVVFPVTVDAGTAAGLTLGLDLFFAVCKDVCIPATARTSIDLGANIRDPEGAARVDDAMRQVPVKSEAVTDARAEMEDGKPVLRLTLKDAAEDVFVETTGSAYFRRPRFSADHREAVLAIDNVKDAAGLKGATLTLTIAKGRSGLEQTVTLP